MTQIVGTYGQRAAVRNGQISNSLTRSNFSAKRNRVFPNACEQLAVYFSQIPQIEVRNNKNKSIASVPGPYLAKIVRHASWAQHKLIYRMRKILRFKHGAGAVPHIHHRALMALEHYYTGLRAKEQK